MVYNLPIITVLLITKILVTIRAADQMTCPNDNLYLYGTKCYAYFWGSFTDAVDVETATTAYCGNYPNGSLFAASTLDEYNGMINSGVLMNFTNVTAWTGYLYNKAASTFYYPNGTVVGSANFLPWVNGQYWASGQPNPSVSQAQYQNVSSKTYINDSINVCVVMKSKTSGSGNEFMVSSCNEHYRALCVVPAVIIPAVNPGNGTGSNSGSGSSNSGSSSNNNGSGGKNSADKPNVLSVNFVLATVALASGLIKSIVP